MIIFDIILMGTLICLACLIFRLVCLSVARSLGRWWNDERPLKQQWMKFKELWNESPGWRSLIVVVMIVAYGWSIVYHLAFIM